MFYAEAAARLLDEVMRNPKLRWAVVLTAPVEPIFSPSAYYRLRANLFHIFFMWRKIMERKRKCIACLPFCKGFLRCLFKIM